MYAPTRIAVGTGYYAVNPLNYDSLIKEKTWVKNQLAGSSMQNEVEYAHKLDKDLSVTLNDFTNFTYDPLFKSQRNHPDEDKRGCRRRQDTHRRVAGERRQPTARIPTSLTSMENPHSPQTTSSLRSMRITRGTYHVEKNMTLAVPYTKNQPTYDWLPCSCNEGWNDMTIHDQRYHSAKGFFDGTSCPFPVLPIF